MKKIILCLFLVMAFNFHQSFLSLTKPTSVLESPVYWNKISLKKVDDNSKEWRTVAISVINPDKIAKYSYYQTIYESKKIDLDLYE